MNLFGGGGGSKVKPQYTGLATQTSTSIVAVTIGMGLSRAAPNIIYQTDFQSHAQKQKTGKGGGSQTVGYTYSGTYILAMGWGPSTGCRRVWKDQSKETDFTVLGFTLIAGNIPQDPWGYLTTNHPTEALGYPGLILMCVPNYDLGQSNALSQHSFEMEWPLLNTAPGGVGDADPALCVDLLLNSQIFGVLGASNQSIPLENLLSTGAAPTTGDAAFQTYCKAMGFGMSPLLDSQEPALDVLKRWTMILNSALIWTGYSVFFKPYGADTITANGVKYLPDTAIQFALGDDDFIRADGEDPIIVRRKSPADCFNFIPLEIRNRSNEYNLEPIGIPDQGLADQYGLKKQSTITAHEICEPAIGAVCAALVQQRQAYIRNEFDFTIGPNFMLLLPGAIGTITDPRFGTQTIMIVDISETDDGNFAIIAEEWADSVGSAGPSSPQDVTNNPVNTAEPAGPVNPPIVFEPPSSLAGSTAQVWMAVSGGNGSVADANWGGCFVWLSTDNVTYQQVGTIDSPARMGALTATLASYGAANPDTTHTLKVSLAESAGVLTGVSASDAAAGVTLSVIKDAGGTLEFLSYRDETLTGSYAYDLGGQLYRHLEGSSGGSHVSGAAFARLDENIFKFDLPAEFIGATLYAKFQSFNIFGGGLENLASCTAYSYTPIGAGYGGGSGGVPTTPTTPTVSAPTGYNFLTWPANPASDNVIRYDVYRATGLSQPFGSSSLIGSSSGTSYTDGTAIAGAAYTYFLKAVNAVGPSSPSAGANITSAASSSVLRFYGSIDGRPDAGEELFDIEMLGGENFSAGFPDNLGGCDVAPTGSVTFPIKQAGSTVGSMNIAAGATVATWTLASGLSFTAGQRFSFYAPTTQDPTLSGPRYTFAGRK